LLTAIEELIAYVTSRLWGAGGKDHVLSSDDFRQVAELEGRVVGLLATVAGGRLSFQHIIDEPKRQGSHYTAATGVKYSHVFGGVMLEPSHHWKTKMQSLRAAAQAIVDEEAADKDTSLDTPKKPGKKKLRGPRNFDQLLKLKHLIQSGEADGKMKIDIALKFTKDDDLKAQALLRQLRRHKEYLDRHTT